MPVAVVTGAGAGIGAAVAGRLAEQGHVVVAADRDEPSLARLVERLAGRGPGVHPVTADVTAADQVADVFARARRVGPVEVLVNNAGTTPTAPLHELSEREWDTSVAACLKPVFLCCRAAIADMRDRGGAIVNIASVLHRMPGPGLAAYAAAKGAIVALSKQIAVEYGWLGVRCNVVSPGWIRTPSTEARLRGPTDEAALLSGHASPRLGVPGDVAAAVAFLAGPQAAFLNGVELVVDGASTLVTGARLLRQQASKEAP